MSKQEIRIECLSEIFEELGIVANKEQIKKVVEDFSLHIEMEGELYSYQHIEHKEECFKCKKLRLDIDELYKNIDIYQKTLKNNLKTDNIFIDGDTVYYKK